MNISWSRRSLHDLADILRFTGSEVFILRLIKRALKIPSFPLAGKRIPDLEEYGLREVVWRKYRIVYKIKDDLIEIVTVCHTSRILSVE
ncbi:MAG: type II toxin-antitoxin system RelE/ParE family toxin [Calditrichota bacterium]